MVFQIAVAETQCDIGSGRPVEYFVGLTLLDTHKVCLTGGGQSSGRRVDLVAAGDLLPGLVGYDGVRVDDLSTHSNHSSLAGDDSICYGT